MTVRCFVAIPVASDVRDALDDALADLRSTFDLAWTRPVGWHVTLAFCGDVDDDRVDEVVEVVRLAAVPSGRPTGPVRLTLGEAQPFGRALTLAVTDDPPGTLVDLGDRVQAGLVAAGIPVVRRRVRPHLTLARRRGVDVGDPVGAVDAALAPSVWSRQERAWDARDVGVWRSTLGRGPARHDVVASVPLVG